MNHADIAALMKGIAPVVRNYVGIAVAPLRAENEKLSLNLAEMQQRFANLSAEREQDKIVFINLVKEEVSKIEIPTKEIDPVEIERVVVEQVEKAVSAFPVPANGKDAEPAEPVDLDEVAVRAAKLLPVPENGKDADIEVVRAIIVEEVAKVAPEDGKDADPAIIRSMVVEEVSKIETPKDGKDADPEAIRAAVLDVVAAVLPGEVSAAVDKIEKPKDGKDAEPVDPTVVANLLVDLMPVPKDGKDGADGKSVTLDDVAPLIEDAVSKITLPEGLQGAPGEPGKSVTIEDVMPVLEGMVAALPVPENSKDADIEAIKSMVIEEVAKIDTPKDGVDGKNVEIEDLIPVVAAAVEKAVAGIAPPKDGEPGAPGADGKSITIDDVRPMIEEIVSAIEPAKDGKDADPAAVASLIIEDVAKLIPVPADGKGVTVDDVLPAIQAMIAQKFSEIAKPKDGVDGADVVDLLIDHSGMLVATLSNGKTKTLGPIIGKDAEIEPLERMIEEKLESIQAPELDKATVAKFVEQELERISKDFRKSDDFVPDDVASNVALVVKMMAETPQSQVQRELQPINVYSDVRLPEMKFPETVVNVTVPEQQAPIVNMAAPIINVEPAKVEMPKRGKEVTTVKSWTKDGRIASFEKKEVDE